MDEGATPDAGVRFERVVVLGSFRGVQSTGVSAERRGRGASAGRIYTFLFQSSHGEGESGQERVGTLAAVFCRVVSPLNMGLVGCCVSCDLRGKVSGWG